MIESVLDGTHPRSGAWDVIAAGTITNVEPHQGNYAIGGATITMNVRYWLRGGDGRTLEFYDPPAGSAGVGFEAGSDYLVLAYEDPAQHPPATRLATGLCHLTYRLADYERVKELAARFGASMPDTALPTASSPLSLTGVLLVALGALLASGPIRDIRLATLTRRCRTDSGSWRS